MWGFKLILDSQKWSAGWAISIFISFPKTAFLTAYFSPSFKQYLKTNTQISISGFFKVLNVWIMPILKANNMFQLCLVWTLVLILERRMSLSSLFHCLTTSKGCLKICEDVCCGTACLISLKASWLIPLHLIQYALSAILPGNMEDEYIYQSLIQIVHTVYAFIQYLQATQSTLYWYLGYIVVWWLASNCMIARNSLFRFMFILIVQ